MLGWMAMRKRLIAKALICTSLLLPSFAFANNNLTIADTQGDWGVLAPFLHSARGPGFVYTSFLFDSLIWKATDGKLQPLLAQSWQLNEASQCYEFKLHPDAVWQDGQAVTAKDVVFSLPLVNAMSFVAFNPDSVHVEFTQTGIALGIPLPYNKTALFFTTKPANNLKE